MDYERPERLNQALQLLKADNFRIIAGGTDYYPSLGDRVSDSPVLDVTAISELRNLTLDKAGLTIGSLCTWSDIARADLPVACRALQLASVEVGSVQIQNRATIAGNLCNASPAADGVPPLLCCDAMVKLASTEGSRTLPLAEFIQGNRQTELSAEEMLTSIFIPADSCRGQSDFLKLGARKYLVISIAMVATRLSIEHGVITDAAIAVGSCSEVATRLPDVETALVGQAAESLEIADRVSDHFNILKPIDDVRSSASYRHDASVVLVRRSLQRCLEAGTTTA